MEVSSQLGTSPDLPLARRPTVAVLVECTGSWSLCGRCELEGKELPSPQPFTCQRSQLPGCCLLKINFDLESVRAFLVSAASRPAVERSQSPIRCLTGDISQAVL